MYISGITVEKKKTTLKLGSNAKLQSKLMKQSESNKQQRPFSSEQKTDLIQNHYSIGPSKRRNVEARLLSQNKISVKKPSQKKISLKPVENQNNTEKQDKQKGNMVLSLKPKNKRPASDVNSTSSIRLNPEQMIKITYYFRYLPVSVYSSIGLKQQLMKNLSQQRQIKTINPYKKPPTKKDITEYWMKLNKNAQLKGKYKYRQKFNYAYCAQLKALDYKRRQFKKKKQSSSSQSDDDQKMQKCRDMDTWKKSMGIDGKVFIIKGKYPDLRQALLERGWVQNQDKKSTFYDLRWTTKISDINFANLKSNQIVNHFDNNACLTSKYGLIKSIRSVLYPQNMDIDRFFPKAYDLSDLSDFENFIQMFKWIYCESMLKKFYYKIQQVNIQRLKLCIILTQRRLCSIQNILKSAINSHYPFCSTNQWNYLTDKPCDMEEINRTINNSIFGDNIDSILQNLLQRLEEAEPQYKLNGFRNIWIVKPAFLSRGRGIRCLTNLNDILDTCLGKQTQYVVQKYIENPLIINKRKFDIRVWVVIQDYNPPKIWFYNQFYLRFCLEDYNTQALKNRYAHLTNNSVQKYNSKIGSTDLDSSMWNRETFEKFICENYGEDKFKILLGKMKQIVIATILGTVDQVYGRRGSFQQIGYDMMIDQNLNPWLIQVNSSPAMDYSTPITRKLVKMVMEDIAKIIVDLRKKKNAKVKTAGQFKCIYSGVQSFKNKYFRIGGNDKNDQ